jgi:hypothetical protein
MGQGKPAERGVAFADCDRRKLVQHRKLHPFDIDMKLALEMTDKWQGQLVKAANTKTDPQSVCLTKGGLVDEVSP